MRQLLLIGLLILIPALLYGQPAPNRSAEVAAVVRQHLGALGGDPSTIDDRKREVLHVIVATLNQQDRGLWGELLKTDQGGYVPADIIVWRPTLEHFDVLTDSGPMWGPYGPVTNPAWLWVQAPLSSVPDSPSTSVPLPPVVSVDYDRIRQMIQASHDDLYQQAERMFADEVARSQALAGQLQQHDQSPSMLGQVFGNRYVQMLLAGLGVFIEETMRR